MEPLDLKCQSESRSAVVPRVRSRLGRSSTLQAIATAKILFL